MQRRPSPRPPSSRRPDRTQHTKNRHQHYERSYGLEAQRAPWRGGDSRLVEEEYVSVRVPRMGIPLGSIQAFPQRVHYRARAQLHEQARRAGAPRTAVYPHQNIILGGVLSTFEEVEKQMLGAIAHIKIAAVRIDGGLAESFG